MPNLTISVPHQLTQEEALGRVKRGIAHLKTQYSSQMNNLQESWDGNVGKFSFSALGFPVSGVGTVNPQDVTADIDLPFAAAPFKGKIESALREKLTNLLA